MSMDAVDVYVPSFNLATGFLRADVSLYRSITLHNAYGPSVIV